MVTLEPLKGNWINPDTLPSRQFVCGYCGGIAASHTGYRFKHQSFGDSHAVIVQCSYCFRPTYFEGGHLRSPGALVGRNIKRLPEDVDNLYREARIALKEGAPTACVLSLRKILMHVAVQEGADENAGFGYYVDYLDQKHFIPPKGKHWVEKIKDGGNDANHQIKIVDRTEAEELVRFTEVLLIYIYELSGDQQAGVSGQASAEATAE